MGVRGVTDLMMAPGLVNLDFADIRTVMAEMGKAMMGTGEAEGENRAIRAAEAAISNPLLEDTSMSGARGLLINITGGDDLTLFEVDQAANRIREEVDEEANIIFGSAIDETLSGRIRVSVVATGIDSPAGRSTSRGRGWWPWAAARCRPRSRFPSRHTWPRRRWQGSPAGRCPASPMMTAAAPLRHPSAPLRPAAYGEPIVDGSMALEMPAVVQPTAPVQSVMPPRVAPTFTPRTSSGLFNEAPRPTATPAAPAPVPEVPRTSLFNTVTGVLRRRMAPPMPVEGAAPRHEPMLHPEQRTEPARASVRLANGSEETTLEIPAFLRRQTS